MEVLSYRSMNPQRARWRRWMKYLIATLVGVGLTLVLQWQAGRQTSGVGVAVTPRHYVAIASRVNGVVIQWEFADIPLEWTTQWMTMPPGPQPLPTSVLGFGLQRFRGPMWYPAEGPAQTNLGTVVFPHWSVCVGVAGVALLTWLAAGSTGRWLQRIRQRTPVTADEPS